MVYTKGTYGNDDPNEPDWRLPDREPDENGPDGSPPPWKKDETIDQILEREREDWKTHGADYSSIDDYFNAIIKKTYNVLNDTPKGKELIDGSTIEYCGADGMSAGPGEKMIIKLPGVKVEAIVYRELPLNVCHERSNVRLEITASKLKCLKDVDTVNVYGEVAKALDQGLTQYRAVKVFYR